MTKRRFTLTLLGTVCILTTALFILHYPPCYPWMARFQWMTSRIAGWYQVRAEKVPDGRGGKACVYSFTIKPDDPLINNGVRAEFEVPRRWSNGETTVHQFSSRFGTGALDLPAGVAAQWHETVAKGSPNFRPPLAHRLRAGRLLVSLWNDQIFEREGSKGEGLVLATIEKLDTKIWYAFKYEIHWDPQGAGRVRGWKRECSSGPECEDAWEPWIDYQGPIGYGSALDYYLKFGAYTTRAFQTPVEISHRFAKAGAD